MHHFVSKIVALGLLMFVCNPVSASPLEEKLKQRPAGKLGICKLSAESSESFRCELTTFDEKPHLIFFNDKLEPILLIRLEDGRVLWKAGTGI